MRHATAFLISLGIHASIAAAIVTTANLPLFQPNDKSKPKTVSFELATMLPVVKPQSSKLPQTNTIKEEKAELVSKPEVKKKPSPATKKIKPSLQPKKQAEKKKIVKKKPKKKVTRKKHKKVVTQKSQQKNTQKIQPIQQQVKKSTIKQNLPVNSNNKPSATPATQIRTQTRPAASGGKDFSAYRQGLNKAIDRAAQKTYPRNARRMRKGGTVHVSFQLNKQGKITHIKIIKSSGNRMLDKAAIKALRRLGKYKAPPSGFSSYQSVPIKFTINQ